jgi:hypothetical protein
MSCTSLDMGLRGIELVGSTRSNRTALASNRIPCYRSGARSNAGQTPYLQSPLFQVRGFFRPHALLLRNGIS